MRSGGERALPARTVVLWAFFALLLPTIYFKNGQLHSLYPGGLSTVLRSVVDHPNLLERAYYTLAFYSRDVAESAVIVAVVYFVGCRIFRIRPEIVLPACIFICTLVLGANWLSFREIGTFLTPDTLSLSLEWMRADPGLVWTYVGFKGLGFLPLLLAWCAAPVLLLRRVPDRGIVARARRGISTLWLAGAFLAGAGLSASVKLVQARGPLPLWGYWSSSTRALAGIDAKPPVAIPRLGLAELRDEYTSLAYPAGKPAVQARLMDFAGSSLHPRHIVIVGLETAPRKYYPILDNPEMPAFFRMRDHAIVSERHYTTRPYTAWANYSILSGTYPARPKDLGRSTVWEGDGLPAILAREGYTTSFIDSYKIDWHEGGRYRRILVNLGLKNLVDTTSDPDPRPHTYDTSLAKERRSLRRALECLLDAQRRGEKALVFVSTLFGHYGWKARPQDAGLPANQKIYKNCQALDGVLGEFLQTVEQSGLAEDLVLVVTGDHGLRNEAEFVSLGEPMRVGDPAFNVPFVLYAPGLVAGETKIPWPTSHIDLAPTLLELIGSSSEPYLMHGEDMLGDRLRDRVLFLLNYGLTPTDGYLWKGRFLTYNNLTGAGALADGDDYRPIEPADGRLDLVPGSLRDPGRTIERAKRFVNATALYFATKRAGSKTLGG